MICSGGEGLEGFRQRGRQTEEGIKGRIIKGREYRGWGLMDWYDHGEGTQIRRQMEALGTRIRTKMDALGKGIEQKRCGEGGERISHTSEGGRVVFSSWSKVKVL